MVTRSSEFPQLAANSVGTNENAYGNGFPVRTKFSTYAADATFQLDLFGRLRRATESARAQLLSTEYAQKTQILTLVSDVASDYFQLLTLDLQLQVARETVTTQQDAVKLTTQRLQHGIATRIDVLQAQQVLDTANAQVPDLERQIGQQEDAISILLGDYPHGVGRGRPLAEQPMPPEVPPGVPSSLLARRPDISEAEQNLISFNAQGGVATADFYPTFTLTGAAGFESASFDHILDWRSAVASITPAISVPIFEGGRLQANLAAVQAQYRQAVAAYLNQVLTAYGDVEDALTDVHALSDEVTRMRAAVAASQGYLNAATVHYKQGLVNYLVVIDAERTLLTNQLTLSQDINQQMAASVHLIKALGGGWDGKNSQL